MAWTINDAVDLTDKTVVITGITGGLGEETALALGKKGARVIGTARNGAKANSTLERLNAEAPQGHYEILELDLADLSKVRSATKELQERVDHLDILINNAGIMATPEAQTADGFEMQIGTNHIGHFAWTARLWPLLKSSNTRIVTVASNAHTFVKGLDLQSVTHEGSSRKYRRWTSYGESKLANLLFALELDRRIKAAGLDVLSVAAHPGYSSTHLTATGPQSKGFSIVGVGMHLSTKVIAQSARAGAWPQLMAATDDSLAGGEYVGPKSFFHMRGKPELVGMTRTARDATLAENLWATTETAIGQEFAVR